MDTATVTTTRLEDQSVESVAAPTRPDQGGGSSSRTPRWPFVILGLAMVWSILIRVPLILNASAHLDSDLSVDGLTLIEMTKGHWRWHYPGTPHIGIAPAFLSLPQALWLGTTPATLVSGGAVIHLLVMIACFALAWRCFGPIAACWSLIPLTFASTGLIWLSGRITGGHLLSVAMHAGIFLGFHAVAQRPTRRSALALGVWSGLSVWVDTMAVVSLAAMLPVAVLVWAHSGFRRAALVSVLFFLIGLPIGLAPKLIGDRVDRYDAYNDQFTMLLDSRTLMWHFRLLTYDCLPRLIAGHRIPYLQTDPQVYEIPTSPGGAFERDQRGTFAEIPAHAAIILFLVAFGWVAFGRDNMAEFATRLGLLIASLAVMVAFVVNRNIFNSDNYRYLVFLIVPWSLGIGRAFGRLSSKGAGGLAAALVLTVGYGAVMTLDAFDWYRRFGWIVDNRPVVAQFSRPALDWLEKHPEVDGIMGNYWDVYLYSFLTGGRVKVVPYPIYPDRFPEWKKRWPHDQPPYFFSVRGRGRDGGGHRIRAERGGGILLFEGQNVSIYQWPKSDPIPIQQ